MSYYRESFELQPIKIFLNSNAADTIRSRGDITYNLRRTITLPSGTIGYVSLNELTIPNTNYNINSSNNVLVMTQFNGVPETFTVTPGNYTVTELRDALNVLFGNATFMMTGVSVSYNSNTNKFTFTDTLSPLLVINSQSTMNAVLGFEAGEVDLSVPNVTGTILKSTIPITQKVNMTAANNSFSINYNGNGVISFVFVLGNNFPVSGFAPAIQGKLAQLGIPVTCTFDSINNVFIFENTTNNNNFVLGGTSLATFGFDTTNPTNFISAPLGTSCTLTSQKIVDLSGNNSFYVTTNLGLGNYSFLSTTNTGGANVLAKVQLTTDSTGIEFYNNLTAFKTRFYDTNISSLHIVLYDENFQPWIPQSDWSCVLEMTFYEKFDLTTKMKATNLLFAN